MHRARRRLFAVAVAAGLASGCAGGAGLSPTESLDLTQLAAELPTPPGYDLATNVRAADAAAVQAVFARQASAEAAEVVESTGLNRAAIRTWSGPNGAEYVVVVTRWPDHQRANNWGAGAAEFPIEQDDARAWTPKDIPGARGSKLDGPTPLRALSLAIADVNVFVRAVGVADDATVVRTLDLATRKLKAVVDGDA